MGFLKIDKIYLYVIIGFFIYISGTLILNIDRGFDVTDESFYILNAMYPFDIFSTISHDMYYNHILFFLSGYNLSLFRLYGIVVLILVSIWFALELFEYICYKFVLEYDFVNKLFFIFVIIISSLSYYKYWLITPSYNWLALVSVILVSASIFRIVNNRDKIKGKFFTIEYFILSFSLNLSFFSKPTTLLALIPILILFLIYNYKEIYFKKAFISIFIISFSILFFHIVLLDGGFSSYYFRTIESMKRFELLGGGHNILDITMKIYIDLKEIIFSIYWYKLATFMFLFLLLINIIHHKLKNLIIINMFMISFIFLFFDLIVNTGFIPYEIFGIVSSEFVPILPFDTNNRFVFVLIILIFFILFIYTLSNINFGTSNVFNIIKVLFIMFLLFLMCMSVSFGTNNNIWFHMNLSLIFLASALMILSFVLDNKYNLKYGLRHISGIAVAILIFILVEFAYANPYRLNTDIKNQNLNVNLLGNIKVDNEAKEYIESLIKVKNDKDNKQIYLIDMTGATPGANVILDAKFFGQSWLLGGYKGSNDFVYEVLKNESIDNLKKAWILVAPNGTISLDLSLLSKLDLKFPENYDKISTLFLKSRSEIQELWRPRDNLNGKIE